MEEGEGGESRESQWRAFFLACARPAFLCLASNAKNILPAPEPTNQRTNENTRAQRARRRRRARRLRRRRRQRRRRGHRNRRRRGAGRRARGAGASPGRDQRGAGDRHPRGEPPPAVPLAGPWGESGVVGLAWDGGGGKDGLGGRHAHTIATPRHSSPPLPTRTHIPLNPLKKSPPSLADRRNNTASCAAPASKGRSSRPP